MRIIYTEKNTKIIDSYKLKWYQINDVAIEVLKTRRDRKLPITRSVTSYAREIKAHNRLYKLGIARSHTKDCDCEENIKKWEEMFYRIIGV